MKSSLLTLLTISLFLSIKITNAQDLDTVTITGRVFDQNFAVIPGAEIKATLIKSSLGRTVTSNAAGAYKLIQLEPGTYTVSVSANGFGSQVLSGVVVKSSQTLSLDFTLLPAEVNAAQVIVTAADTPVIDPRRTVVGATLSARESEQFPLANRSLLDLIFTLPGVTEEPLSTLNLAEDRKVAHNNTPEEAGTVSLSGAPAYSNNFTIDGLDNNDDRAARERFQPSLDAIEEVQVITNQFSAEYGRASGGRINMRTRSGSNEFRGRVFYFFRDESLNANSFRNNATGQSRLPLQQHVAGFTFGGPVVIAPRAQFFTAYELDKILDSALIDTLVPTSKNPLFSLPSPTNPGLRRTEEVEEPALPAEVAPFVSSIRTPSKSANFSLRLDQQFTQTHNLTVTYHAGRLTNLRGFGGGNRLAEALQGRRRNSDAISISDNYVFNSAIVNQLRFQYSKLAPAFGTLDRKPVVLIALNDSSTEDDPNPRTGTLIAGSSTSGSSDRRETRYQLQEILSVVNGDHSMKFGVDIHRVTSQFIDLADTTGTFNFASAGDFLANTPSRFRQTFDTTSTQRNTYFGMFAHDEWQVHPSLLVSYGLRYERETILPDTDNFGPRFSLAYNPFLSGRIVIRAGGGIFYNRPLLRTIDDFTLGKQQLFFDTNTLVDPLTGKLLNTEQRRNFIAARLKFPETLTSSSPLVKEFGSLNTNFSRRLDASLRIPESYQVNVGAEFDVGWGLALEVNGTSTRGLHLWREFNSNAARLPVGYSNFTSYLASRDFANFRLSGSNNRPIYNASNAGELVRFIFQITAANPNSINRVIEAGVPVSIFNLNSPTSSTAIDAALAVLNDLRPDSKRAEVEQLIAAGNSFYKGLTIELRRRFTISSSGFGFAFRAGYTLSKLIDDGVVNTSDALVVGDFHSERARSLLDRRHRFVFSGVFNLPSFLGELQLSPILRVASGAPFNISLGGTDRNLDDVENDRPSYSGHLGLLKWRRPGESINPSIVESFSQPLIGGVGNLPRNAGRGPGLFMFDLSVAREFRLSERVRVRPVVEFDNVLNKTVFSFGAEFVNFNALSPSATEEQRQAFLDSFLVATRTLRSREIRVGLRIEF